MNIIIEQVNLFVPARFFQLLSTPEMFAFSLAFLASMGTFVGGVVVVGSGWALGVKGQITKKTSNLIGLFQSFSAGVMLYMTFIDLIPEAIEVIGRLETLSWFFIGVVIFSVIVYFFPEDTEEYSTENKKKKTHEEQKAHLIRASFFTYMGMLLHNLPEGLSVYLSAMSNVKLGVQLALGIMLHNIPEGMAVAIPIWAATGSPSYVLWMTFLNGLAEPVGVIIGGFLLKNYLNAAILSRSLAIVSGIMAFISLYELFPSAITFSGRNHASAALFMGMLICFVALESVEHLIHFH